MFVDALAYLADGANWVGDTGVLTRIVQHLGYSTLSVLLGMLVAVPLGLLIGHTGRGEALVVGVANAVRALPSLGLMTLLVLLMGVGLLPPILALVALAIPPLLAGAYSGVANVDRATVGAARSLGMTERQVLLRVEVPNAAPLIVGGIRGAMLQVVATATIAAYVNLGGLGRYIFDGLAVQDYGRVMVGALLVTLLALALDVLLARAVRWARPGAGLNRVRDPEVLAEIDRRAEPSTAAAGTAR